MLPSMNLHGADVALNKLEVWMLLSMNLRAVDIALIKLEWCNVNVALNEYTCYGCCSR